MTAAPDWGQQSYREALVQRARYLHVDKRVRVKFDVDDLVNETLMRAVAADRGSSPFRGTTEGERFKYLFTIQSRVLADWHAHYVTIQKRSATKERDLQAFNQALTDSLDGFARLPMNQTSVSVKASHREEEDWMLLAISQLPERERQAMTLRKQGQTLAQIAAALDDTVFAVGSLITRATAKLSRMRPGASSEG